MEMLLATLILLVGLVAIAQLVPATILLNFRNRTDSSALVFAQRELDQMLAQPLTAAVFSDSLGNTFSYTYSPKYNWITSVTDPAGNLTQASMPQATVNLKIGRAHV